MKENNKSCNEVQENSVVWNENFIRIEYYSNENSSKFSTNSDSLYFIQDDSNSSSRPSSDLDNTICLLQRKSIAVNRKPSTDKKQTSLLVEKRNARERHRVRAVNAAFEKLRQMVPTTAIRKRRVSKLKTLQKATNYIKELIARIN